MSDYQTGADTIQDAADKATETVLDAADKATAFVASAGARTQDAYSRAAERAQDVADTIDPFVQQRPYLAVAIAAGIGLVVGLLLAGNGPKIVYVDGYRD